MKPGTGLKWIARSTNTVCFQVLNAGRMGQRFLFVRQSRQTQSLERKRQCPVRGEVNPNRNCVAGNGGVGADQRETANLKGWRDRRERQRSDRKWMDHSVSEPNTAGTGRSVCKIARRPNLGQTVHVSEDGIIYRDRWFNRRSPAWFLRERNSMAPRRNSRS